MWIKLVCVYMYVSKVSMCCLSLALALFSRSRALAFSRSLIRPLSQTLTDPHTDPHTHTHTHTHTHRHRHRHTTHAHLLSLSLFSWLSLSLTLSHSLSLSLYPSPRKLGRPERGKQVWVVVGSFADAGLFCGLGHMIKIRIQPFRQLVGGVAHELSSGGNEEKMILKKWKKKLLF